MPQAIITKWIPVTAHRPNRIKAMAASGSLTVSTDEAEAFVGNHGLDAAHRGAALMLVKKLGWEDHRGQWIGGGTPDGNMAFVLVTPSDYPSNPLSNS